jgi:predicted RNA-binding Zn ribbon-like protein
MADAVALRESIYRIFSATAHGRSPAKGDLDILNSYLAKAMSKAHIAKEGDHFRWGWNATDPSPDMMLWPIAKSAAEVLTSEKLALVKECANEEEGCGWLFLDSSRSGNRAWCSMKDCGNRAKFRTYYARHSRSAVSRRTKVS